MSTGRFSATAACLKNSPAGTPLWPEAAAGGVLFTGTFNPPEGGAREDDAALVKSGGIAARTSLAVTDMALTIFVS